MMQFWIIGAYLMTLELNKKLVFVVRRIIHILLCTRGIISRGLMKEHFHAASYAQNQGQKIYPTWGFLMTSKWNWLTVST